MQTTLTLSEQISQMGLGDHICLIYRNFEEQMNAVIPYIKQGLENNEACAYIVDDRTLEEIKRAMKIAGIDTDKEEERGALTFATKREAYLKSGSFDPAAMMTFLREAMQDALKNKYTGFRVTGEMTWAIGNECGCDRLAEYEALLNEFFPGSKATAICQYNQERFDPVLLKNVLRSHPVAILDNRVCTNIYYEPPRMVLNEEDPKEKLHWMLEQLKNYHKVHLDLKNAVRTRDEFLSIASHELKTPLTSLKLQSQGMNKIVEKETLRPDFKNILSKVMVSTEKQVDRLSKLVDDLLDVSQINSGKLTIKPEHVELNELVKTVTERFFPTGAQIRLEMKDGINGSWDRFRLEQVVSNLIGNAIKYGAGSDIVVRLDQNEKGTTISVSDKGPGIAPEYLDRIFLRFERATNPNEVSGLGLGLYISKEIVEGHDGNISVESELGKGSTFTIRLPRTSN